jgi:MFS family permease
MGAYICLLVSSAMLAFVLGSLQFYLIEHFVNVYGSVSRVWVVQLVSAVVTTGAVVMYVFSGPLAASFHKRRVMAASLALALICIVAGGVNKWLPNAWAYLFPIGLMLGVYNAGKMASVPLAATMLRRSNALINGFMSVVFLLGLLTGFPCGTLLHNRLPQSGYLVIAAILGIAAAIAVFCRFPGEQRRPFRSEQRRILHETVGLFQRHWLFVFGGPLLWGIAGAAQLAIVALIVRTGVATPQVAAMIPLFAALGAITGTLFSPLVNRYWALGAVVASALMTLVLPVLPYAAVSYPAIATMTAVMGALFGMAVNLIDSKLLERVGAEGREGTGAALQSAMLAFCMVVIGGGLGMLLYRNIVHPDWQFVILALVTCLPLGLTVTMLVRYGRVV